MLWHWHWPSSSQGAKCNSWSKTNSLHIYKKDYQRTSHEQSEWCLQSHSNFCWYSSRLLFWKRELIRPYHSPNPTTSCRCQEISKSEWRQILLGKELCRLSASNRRFSSNFVKSSAHLENFAELQGFPLSSVTSIIVFSLHVFLFL